MRRLRQAARTANVLTSQLKGLRVKDVRAMKHPRLGDMVLVRFTNGREWRVQVRPGDYILGADFAKA